MSSFCILPFLHIAGKTSGTYRLCCNSPQSNIEPGFKMGRDSIKSVWNSPFYKSVRNKMLNDENVPQCSVCAKNENLGIPSKRNQLNKVWEDRLGSKKINEIKQGASRNNGHLEYEPIGFDLRLGNLCNLKCRMCSAMVSLPIEKEWVQLQKKYNMDQFDELAESYLGCQYMKDWFLSDEFWNDLFIYAPKMRRLHITGGEPTLIPQNLLLIKKLKELGNNEVEILLNTNVTLESSELFDELEHFKDVTVIASIDGVGQVNDYIRYPSKWVHIEKNLLTLIKKPFNVVISPTIQAYNFFHLNEIIHWIEGLPDQPKLRIEPNLLKDPNFLQLNLLPLEMRKSYWENLKTKIQSSFKFNLLSPFLDYESDYLETQESDFHLSKFQNYTRILDEHRKQNLFDVLPFFKEIL